MQDIISGSGFRRHRVLPDSKRLQGAHRRYACGLFYLRVILVVSRSCER